MRKLLIVAAMVGLTILSVPGAAGAACTVPSTEDGLRRAGVVFVGTVESVSNDDRTAEFEVHWVWKGKEVEEKVTVSGESTDEALLSGDDRRFQAGITYLVASSTPSPPYISDRCSGTRVWQEAGTGGVIPSTYSGVLGDAKPQSPIPVASDEVTANVLDNPLVPIATGVVVAVLLIYAIGKVFRGPEQPTGPGSQRRRSRRSGSRLPNVGRVEEGRLSGGFRRSGVSQAKKLRKRKRGRKRSKKPQRSASKGSLRTDRIAAADADTDADVTA
ncbi:MAG: hypothetical protein QNJ88_01785 [Acidimicrobiia bacterium]|nr:hypothetical protein [Acidimicrobiia bacterium]